MCDIDNDFALGERSNLIMTMQEYKPNIACGPFPSMRFDVGDCQEILSKMFATNITQSFGTDASADIHLPYMETISECFINDLG